MGISFPEQIEVIDLGPNSNVPGGLAIGCQAMDGEKVAVYKLVEIKTMKITRELV